jgi:hypothetical protein
VLLGDFGTAREHDVDPAGGDVGDAGAEVAHQPLAVEAGPDPRLDLRARLFLPRQIFHVPSFNGLPGVPPAGTRR